MTFFFPRLFGVSEVVGSRRFWIGISACEKGKQWQRALQLLEEVMKREDLCIFVSARLGHCNISFVSMGDAAGIRKCVYHAGQSF